MQTGLFKTLVTVAAYVISQLNGGAQPPNPNSQPSGTRSVIGYYSEYYPGEQAPYDSLRNNLNTLTAVVPFSYHLNSSGELSGVRPTQVCTTAHSAGLKVLALVHNYTQQNGFEPSTVHTLLSSSKKRGRAVANILSLIRNRGYDGVNIDFENVPAVDRGNYTSFIEELSKSLRPLGYLVSASVPAKTWDDRNSNWSGAFDLKSLGPWLDQMMIMTYDENGATTSAGPVASLPWVEQVVKYTCSVVPSNKIVMGLAGYGYEWVQGRSGGSAREYGDIENLIKNYQVTQHWDNKDEVPYVSYKSGGKTRIIWYENSSSVSLKLDLVNRYNLGGVVLWRLGSEDPAIWPTIRAKL